MDQFTDALCRPRTVQASAVYSYTQVAYKSSVKAVFVELPAFERHRTDNLDDAASARLQQALMDEMADLTPKQRKALKAMLKTELESRRST